MAMDNGKCIMVLVEVVVVVVVVAAAVVVAIVTVALAVEDVESAGAATAELLSVA